MENPLETSEKQFSETVQPSGTFVFQTFMIIIVVFCFAFKPELKVHKDTRSALFSSLQRRYADNDGTGPSLQWG